NLKFYPQLIIEKPSVFKQGVFQQTEKTPSGSFFKINYLSNFEQIISKMFHFSFLIIGGGVNN
ncbi:hypothetical protein ACQPVP_15620, partial [Clostridium nigeriense]|uniref:hypothetical protein n=1 Tax=Clostridium nigeriense TaxID=1805470 RepID=UPI003D34E1C5